MPERAFSRLDEDNLLELQVMPFFSRFAPNDLQTLLAHSQTDAYPADHLLFERGNPVTNLYVLLDGQVELSTEADGHPCVVDICRQNTILGDVSVFSHDPSDLTARTLLPSRIIAIPASYLLHLLESRFDMQLHVLSVLSLRLRNQVKQIAELKLKTTAQRLGIYLLSLTDQTSGKVRIDFPHDKKRIADELGMQPESLSRSLGKLARIGVDSLPGNSVAIADIGHLRQFCIADD
ncbi:MAG: cyclic nucleotide-binding domain-containing protein [Alphaproteobacteria bacterium]|nr:cyclic nucleotide-binding domain-containing protein [Alphaproteobacteria bacterium]